MRKFLKTTVKWSAFVTINAIFLLLVWLAACSSEPEVVEVTRVVTETVVVEGEAVEVEVTRVVTETVVETVVEEVEEMEEEATGDDLPSATGSEDDSGPLPPEPDDGPKVTSRTGIPVAEATTLEEAGLETAVPHRAIPENGSSSEEPTSITVASNVTANEWQKLCRLAKKLHKKRCG
ncbi:hypothetical protein [Candidatus Leptofilum sp.]|uniref:hypothetical protein n=1 Tax=Candidatus Leptofilum sp. TaxID=3241576 RepID=UPI003B5CBDB9